MRENPAFEHQIREGQRDYNYRQNFASRLALGTSYTIREINNRSSGIGDRNYTFWYYQDLEYSHNIILTILCKNEHYEAFQTRLSNKPFAWKTSEKHKGNGFTNNNGVGQLSFLSKNSIPVENVKITIKNRVYNVPLQGSIMLEVEPETCI